MTKIKKIKDELPWQCYHWNNADCAAGSEEEASVAGLSVFFKQLAKRNISAAMAPTCFFIL